MKFSYIKFLSIFLIFLFFIFIFLGNKFERIAIEITDFLVEFTFKRNIDYGVKFDETGYPLMNLYGEYCYSPIIFCWLIYEKYPEYEKNKKIILEYADLILKRHRKNEIIDMNLYYPVKAYSINSTWQSALADARVIELMDYAYLLTKSHKYLNFANKIMEQFEITIENGGVLSVLDSNAYWYMEYANKDSKPYVLNGMLSSVLVLFKHYNITKDEKALTLAKLGSNAIEKQLKLYDRNGYSYYDLLGKVCSPFYHKYQTNLLKELYIFDNREIFIQMSKKWKNYNEKTFVLKKYIKNPSRRGYVVLIIDFLLCLIISILLTSIIFFINFWKKSIYKNNKK